MAQSVASRKPITFYPIKDYPDYSISEDGIVISWITNRILKSHLEDSGYFSVPIKTVKANFMYIHRLLAMTFIPNPNNLPEVNHKDGNKENNALDNLEWVTGSQNIRHAFTNNLCVTSATCNYDTIDLMVQRLLTEPELTFSRLARELGISDRSSIRKLIKRDLERKKQFELWDHLIQVVKAKGQAVTSNKVIITDMQGREHTFESQAQAAKWLGVSPANVCRAIKSNIPCAGCLIRKE